MNETASKMTNICNKSPNWTGMWHKICKLTWNGMKLIEKMNEIEFEVEMINLLIKKWNRKI